MVALRLRDLCFVIVCRLLMPPRPGNMGAPPDKIEAILAGA